MGTGTFADSPRVKICGIRTPLALHAALDAGADYLGFVFFPPSPRHLTPLDAAPFAATACGRSRSVALVVDADDALLDEIGRVVRPDLIQLHGKETPARVAEIARRIAIPLIKAISVTSLQDAERAAVYRPHVELILFDAKPPKDGPLPGGNGIAFDWRHLETVKQDHPFMLSGGLTPDNVATAVSLTGADIVDVSSGVETRPGEKSPDLIRAFIEAAKCAARTPHPRTAP
jgi:phosphoribosylanthranilate isomerase